jgi:hypothetical protein
MLQPSILVSVEEALHSRGVSIVVPERENHSVGLLGDSFHDAYRIADISRFEELQLLGLVPQELTEQQAADVLAADEREFRDRRNAVVERECSCNGQENGAQGRHMKRSHANLAEVLGNSRGRPVQADGLDVANVYRHLSRWINRKSNLAIGIARADEMQIAGTLDFSETVHHIVTETIDIWPSGTLRLRGGYVQVVCEELNGVAPGVAPPSSGDGSPGPGPGHTNPPIDVDLLPISRRLPGYVQERLRLPVSE